MRVLFFYGCLYFLTIHCFAQKIRKEVVLCVVKTYPAMNLPQDVFTYHVRVEFSKGNTLAYYKLNPSVLKNGYFKPNYFTYDSLKARLQLVLFVDENPYQFSYNSAVNEAGVLMYHAILVSQFSGTLVTYLDNKMIDYKPIQLAKTLGGRMAMKPSDQLEYGDTCTTAYQLTTPERMDMMRWINLDAIPPEPLEEKVIDNNRTQVEKLYKRAAFYFRDQFDIQYKPYSATWYAVSGKNKHARLDSTYQALMLTMKANSKENYTKNLSDLKSCMNIWKEELNQFNPNLATDAPYAWSMYMNMALASDFLEDYNAAFFYWKEADRLATDRKESNRLKAYLQARSDVYYRRYDEQGVYRKVELVDLNKKTPQEEKKLTK